MTHQTLVGQGLHIIEALRSYSDTPHSVGLLRLSSQPDTVTRPDTTPTLLWESYPCSGGIRTRSPSKRASEDPSFYLHLQLLTYILLWTHCM